MRTMTGAIVVALGLAATPVFAMGTGGIGGSAGEGAAPAGAVPFPTLLAATPLLATLPAAALAAAPETVARVPVADAFRLGVLTATVAVAKPVLGVIGGMEGALHRRLTGVMFDFFPVAGSGFHLSAGTRLFQRRNFLAETEASARGLLAGPRAVGGATTYRAGFKKFNPAITAGYSLAMGKLTQVGIEAGALMSSAYSGPSGLARFAPGYRGEHDVRPNAVAQLTFGTRF